MPMPQIIEISNYSGTMVEMKFYIPRSPIVARRSYVCF